jgi:L-2,4-diaminobutyrate transaminase
MMSNGPHATLASGELERLDQHDVLHGFSMLQAQSTSNVVVVDHASGLSVIDRNGREFLDAAGGLWCVNVGYGRTEIADLAAAQMRKLSFFHSFGNYSNEALVRLSERLLRLAPEGMARVAYCSSGSEANDTQVKIVRRYNNLLGRPQKKKIIARLGGYHGSSIGAGSLSGLPMMHRTFDLPIPGILHTLAPDYHRRPVGVESPDAFVRHLMDSLGALIEREGPHTVAAFIAEPVTGGGGVLVPPVAYYRELHKLLEQYDILMIADEVITGFGRTGSWFASPGLGIEPDLITFAKGLTSGYFPMAGCLLSKKVCDVLYSDRGDPSIFGHGFTWSGHPVAAAVANANIDIIEREGLVANSAEVGQYLLHRLRDALGDHPLVGDIRGLGLLIGIELDADRATRSPFADVQRVSALLSRASLDERLLLRGGHDRVLAAMAPPLIATRSDADEIVRRLVRILDRLAGDIKSEGLGS